MAAQVRRYRKAVPWGGRVREHGGRRIDRDVRTRSEIARQVAEDDRLYAAAMAARAWCGTHDQDADTCTDCGETRP